MIDTSLILYGSLRWELLKHSGRHHEVPHDVGLEFPWPAERACPPTRVLYDLFALGGASWSLCLFLDGAYWTFAFFNVPSGHDHPRPSNELLGIRQETPRLIDADNSELASLALQAARDGSFPVARLEGMRTVTVPSTMEDQGETRQAAWFQGDENVSRRAVQLLEKLGYHVVLMPDRRSKTLSETAPRGEAAFGASRAIKASSEAPETATEPATMLAEKNGGAQIADSPLVMKSKGEQEMPTEAKKTSNAVRLLFAVQGAVIFSLLAGMAYLVQGREDDRGPAGFIRHDELDKALKAQRLDFQSELLERSQEHNAALSHRPTKEELNKLLETQKVDLTKQIGAAEAAIKDLGTKLHKLEDKFSALAGDKTGAEELRKQFEELRSELARANEALQAMREAAKKLNDAMNPGEQKNGSGETNGKDK